MSVFRLLIALTLLAAGCTTAQTAQNNSDNETETAEVQKPMMRHLLRDMEYYDAAKMARLVDKEMNMRETDEDKFLRDASIVLSQTVLVQPHYMEREAALRQLKSKIDQEDYLVILQDSASDLIYLSTKSASPYDQATAVVALQNLIIEAKSLKRAELKPTLQKIADAHIQVSDAAKKYAEEPMEHLLSPSTEAQFALKNP